MIAHDLPGWLVDLIGRWWPGGDDVRLLDAALEWHPVWPAAVLVWGLAALGVLVLLLHRSRRLELGKRWRITLGALRAAILAVPVVMLLQPGIAGRFEQMRPRTLAFLLDRSGSMSVRDGEASRWELAGRRVRAVADELSARVAPGDMPTTRPVDVRFYLFDEELAAAGGDDLASPSQVRTEKRTALGQALDGLRSELTGRSVAGVICLSDGADNSTDGEASAVAGARAFGAEGIPVQTALVGREDAADVAVNATVAAPFAYPGDPVPVEVRVTHRGFENAAVTVSVLDGDRTLATQDVVLGDAGRPMEQSLAVTFDTTGKKVFRVAVGVLPGELTGANNSADLEVTVLDEPLRVLYIEHWPRWQYRFLRNAFERDQRFEPRLVLLTEDPSAPEEERQGAALPGTAEEFAGFDAIVIGDVARQDLAPQHWEWIRDAVVDGGTGLIFIAGPAHNPADYLEPPISGLLPFEAFSVVAEEAITPFVPELTPSGRDHPVMRLETGGDPAEAWQRLSGLRWYAGVMDVKPGALALARRRSENGEEPAPLVLLQRAGRGSVLFVGIDETWKWRYEVGNRFFYGFWAGAIQHVGMPHRTDAFQPVRIDVAARAIAPDMPAPVTVSLDAGLAAREGITEDALTLVAEHREGDGKPRSFVLHRSPDAPLVYQGELRLPGAGTYRLYVEGRDGQGERIIEVGANGRFNPELATPQVNPILMRRIAQASGGEAGTVEDLPELVAGLELDPLRFRWTQRVSLWDGWVFLAVFAALLTVEWVARKLKYLP